MNVNLGVAEQLAQGRTMSLDTVAWWMGQDHAARKRAFAPETTDYMDNAKDGLRCLLAQREIEHIWANDPDFDCTILRDWLGYDFKWPFWKHRSMRTLKALYPATMAVHNEWYGEFPAHDPVEDCVYQASQVIHVYREMGTATAGRATNMGRAASEAAYSNRDIHEARSDTIPSRGS